MIRNPTGTDVLTDVDLLIRNEDEKVFNSIVVGGLSGPAGGLRDIKNDKDGPDCLFACFV